MWLCHDRHWLICTSERCSGTRVSEPGPRGARCSLGTAEQVQRLL